MPVADDPVAMIEGAGRPTRLLAVAATRRDPPSRGLPAARSGLARAEIPGARIRDRSATQGEGAGCVEGRAIPGHGPSRTIRPGIPVQGGVQRHLQRLFPARIRSVSWWGTTSSTMGPRTSGSCGGSPTWRRPSTPPFIAAASLRMFGGDDLDVLLGPHDLGRHFASAEYAQWRSFRDTEDARYVGLCLPRLPAASPLWPRYPSGRGVRFRGAHRRSRPPGARVGHAAGRLTDAFARHGWCATIRGVEGGGRITGLPAYRFDLDEQARGRADRLVEIPLKEGTGHDLSKLGFLPLVPCRGADGLAFLSSGSCKNPETYDSDEANDATARASPVPLRDNGLAVRPLHPVRGRKPDWLR